LNSKERFITAIKLGMPDRVPFYEDYISKNVIKKIEGKYIDLNDFVEKWEMDAITIYGNYKKEFINDNTYIDEWNITRKEIEGEYPITIRSPLKNRNDFKHYVFPDPDSEYIYNDLIKAVKRFKDKKAIIFKINDVFSLPRDIRGYENFLMDILDDIKFVKEIINRSVEYNIQLAKNASKYGADIVLSGDDYCDNRGTLVSPSMFKEIFFPGLKKVVEEASRSGLYFIKHTDGNVLPIMDLIIEAGCNAYNPIDLSANMDLAYFKQKFGKKICLIGNLNGSDVLQFGSKEDVIYDIFRCLRDGSYNGGYIMKSSTDIHSKVKPENFITMMESVKKFGKYPIDFNNIKNM